MKIVNLTQHSSTPDQRESGVFDLEGEELNELRRLLTFVDLPSWEEVEQRAMAIANIAKNKGVEAAMIGGAPFIMGPLAKALIERGIRPCFAFSRRESVEEKLPDGTVRKVAVFRHLGFIWQDRA